MVDTHFHIYKLEFLELRRLVSSILLSQMPVAGFLATGLHV